MNVSKTVVIIDDEQDARRVISKYIERHFSQLTVIGEAGSAAEGLRLLETVRPAIVFMDINLGDGSGFDVLDRLRGMEFNVIFTTAFDDFAIKAFRYHAIDYLLKPIDPEAFVEAVTHALQRSVSEQTSNLQNWLAQYGGSERKLAVPTAEGLLFVQLDSIVYLEADGSYCCIYLRDQKQIVVSKPLKFFSDKLERERIFLRPHKSFVINMNFLQEYVKEDGGLLKLTSGALIPISRQRKDDVLKELNEFFL